MADEVLEQLFIDFLGRDDQLEAMYQRMVDRARQQAAEIGQSFQTGFGQGFSRGTDSVAADAKKAETAIEDVVKATREMGETTTRQSKRQTDSVDDVKEAFERLRNESQGLRNAVEAGAVSTGVAITRFKELQEEALDASNAFGVSTKEYKQFTQVAAQASRSVATLEGRTTKLGLSANVSVAVTDSLRRNLDFLGGGAEFASRGFDGLGIALRSFGPVGEGIEGRLRGITIGLRTMALAVPLASAAITAGLAVALFQLSRAAAAAADEIDKASQSAGFSAEAFQEVAFALEQSGVSIDQTRQGLNDFNARLGQAAQGSTSIVDAYRKLGVAIRDSNGSVRDSEQVFTDLITALSGVPSAAEQAAIGGLVFGEEFSRRVIPTLNAGAEGFENLRKQAREMGLVLSNDSVKSLVEFKDELNILSRQFNTAKTEILAGFVPVFTQFLIPLLQNTVVPALQGVGTRVTEFSQKFLDQGEAGVAFRRDMLMNLEAVITIGRGVVAAAAAVIGAVQSILSVGASIGGAIGGLTTGGIYEDIRRGVEQRIEDLNNTLERADLSEEARLKLTKLRDEAVAELAALPQNWLDAGNQAGRAAGANFADGALASFTTAMDALTLDVNAVVERWAQNASASVSLGASSFAANAESAFGGISPSLAIEPPPPGSLAALRQEVLDAQKDFNTAITDADRAAAKERERIAQEAIQTILATFTDSDILAAARAWTGRLTAELQQGVKDQGTVTDLITAGIERVRQEAATAFEEFGWDSQQYRDAITKLEFLEAFLSRISSSDPTITVGVDVSGADRALRENLQALQTRYSGDAALLFTLQSVERTQGTFNSLEEAFTGLARAGVTITAPMLEFLQERFEGTTEAVGQAANAMQAFREAELERLRDIQTARFSGDASVVFTIQAVERTEGQFSSVSDAMRKLSSVGVVITAPMLELLEERFQTAAEGATKLKAALLQVHQAEIQRARDALTARFSDDSALLFTVQAVERTQGAFASVEDAMRKLSDAGVVVTGPMLEYLVAQFEGATAGAETTAEAISRIVDVELPQRLAAAAASAALFGTQASLAGESADILKAAIERILLLDPEADVSAQLEAWKAWRVELGKGTAATKDLSGAQAELEAAMRQLETLTGEAPDQFELLEAAFRKAAEQGLITKEELEELLAVIEKLSGVDAATRAMRDLAANIDIGTQIATGLTEALEGVRDGDLSGVLSGLTGIGTAIGFALGGPAGAALAQSIGQAVQALPALFQVISDLFTGDSPARRELAASLTQTIEGAVRSGVDAGLRGADDWRDTLRTGIRESVVGALVDAFIEAAVTQAIIAPFIDQFTRIMNQQGREAALAFLSANLDAILSQAEGAAGDIVRIFDRFFDDVEDPLSPNAGAGVFELPDATVGVIAAPDWASDLTLAAADISEAGAAMLEAATLMRDTMQAGINVNNTSERGIDAHWAAQ